ncbi:MAG: hypothetical protein ACFE89_02705 [Candidatus Hodarchaeota archaeon]
MSAYLVAQIDFIDFFLNIMFGGIGLIFVLFIVIFVGVFVFIIYMVCKSMRSAARSMDAVKIPEPETPRRERHLIRESLPEECPECDAPLKYNEVKWVGPRRAECPYCGNVVDLEDREFTETY